MYKYYSYDLIASTSTLTDSTTLVGSGMQRVFFFKSPMYALLRARLFQKSEIRIVNFKQIK